MPCKPPRIWTQLNNGEPTASWDCGVMGIIRSLDFASCGQVILTVKEARSRAGKPGKVPTNPADWKRAIEHPKTAADFKAAGFQPPKARLLDGSAIKDAEDGLHNDRLLTAACWYGTLNTSRPDKSASLTFRDNHAMSFLGLTENAKGKKVSVEYDPLADGRTRMVNGKKVTYPKGPQTFPWELAQRMFADVHVRVRNANGQIVSEHKLGAGLVLGITVARSKPLNGGSSPTPPVEPTPVPPDLADELAAARRGLAAAAAYSAQAHAALDALDDDIEAALAASGGPL